MHHRAAAGDGPGDAVHVGELADRGLLARGQGTGIEAVGEAEAPITRRQMRAEISRDLAGRPGHQNWLRVHRSS